MKKKQITSKLHFQKTTVVSFNTMKNIVGGTMVDVNTEPITQKGVACVTVVNDCQTQTLEGAQTCITCTGTDCDHPTTRTVNTDGCNNPDVTKRNCVATGRC
ncbi:MAG: hypothetical protein AAF611_05465 [Bacteroidota bacterium]